MFYIKINNHISERLFGCEESSALQRNIAIFSYSFTTQNVLRNGTMIRKWQLITRKAVKRLGDNGKKRGTEFGTTSRVYITAIM